MSQTQTLRQPVDSQDGLREQIEEVLEPHTLSAQARGDPSSERHNDGERIYKDFSIEPFHKYIARGERHDKNVATYPSAWVTPLLHLNEREIELVEELTGRVDYDFRDPHPSHEALEGFPRQRAKMIEWVADDDGDRLPPNAVGSRTIDAWTAGGTDCQIYGAPGSGKSTLAQFIATVLTQLNNETVLWADTLDDSGTNERLEWLPLAPYIDIAVPEGIPITVRIVPEDPTLDEFELDLEEICRDVVRYSSPRDLNRQLLPGQIYVVFPDPLLRGCDDVSQWTYTPPSRVTPIGEEGPDSSTPTDHWWFAWMAARITHDDFVHWTSVILDEAGNVLDPDARKDEHDSYQKVKWWSQKFADARKKGVSLFTLCHALSEIHQLQRRKQRWWLTMSGMSPPINETMPGNKSCPMEVDYTTSMPKGKAQVWNTRNYASISWPNLKRQGRIDAEISIDFDLEAVIA
jgi:hypothetical protein